MEELLGALLGQQQGEERPSDQDFLPSGVDSALPLPPQPLPSISEAEPLPRGRRPRRLHLDPRQRGKLVNPEVVRVPGTCQAEWSTWAKPREVPFYADTLSSWYPFPSLAALLLLAALGLDGGGGGACTMLGRQKHPRYRQTKLVILCDSCTGSRTSLPVER